MSNMAAVIFLGMLYVAVTAAPENPQHERQSAETNCKERGGIPYRLSSENRIICLKKEAVIEISPLP